MTERRITLPLHRIAHGRSGDKGNRLNVSVIAYHPEAWPVLLDEVTEERVRALFAHRGASRVTRYALPRLAALNFVIDDALEGGVNSGLGLDTHGKASAFRVLSLLIEMPEALAHRIAVGPPDKAALHNDTILGGPSP
jgi:hypothetical protein